MKKYQAKISFLKQTEKGDVKKCSEEYLVNAWTFTEAEANLQEHLQEKIPQYDLIKLAISNITEEIDKNNDDTFWKVRLAYLVEMDGKVKKQSDFVLVNANNTTEATQKIENWMNDSVCDFEVVQISETPIIEVV